jgi:two-component system sensor histidine kinase/response regulator
VTVTNATEFWDREAALRRIGHDEELLRDLCNIFLEESPKQMQKLQEAIAAGDAEGVMRAAHSLKGELSYLGAGRAAQIARQLEDMGRNRHLTECAELCANLEQALARLHLDLKGRVGELP